MYLEGKGVHRDPVQGAHFLRTAAEKGLAVSQYELCRLNAEGKEGLVF